MMFRRPVTEKTSRGKRFARPLEGSINTPLLLLASGSVQLHTDHAICLYTLSPTGANAGPDSQPQAPYTFHYLCVVLAAIRHVEKKTDPHSLDR